MAVRDHQIPPWSMLHDDILETILARLDLADHARFASVCSAWRSIAKANPPISKPLGLVISDNPERLIARFLTPLNPPWSWAKLIGCLEGWVVADTDTGRMFLLDTNAPLAERVLIPLPPSHPRHRHAFQHQSCKAVLSSPPARGDCTVVMRLHDDSRLAFCKLGDESFTVIDSGIDFITDLVFYREQLHVIDNSGALKVFDSGLNSEPTQLASPPSSSNYRLVHLAVSCDDKLLAIGRAFPGLPFKVFELDRSHSRWVEIKCLGGRSLLLVDAFFSMSLWAGDDERFRGNRIYHGGFPFADGRSVEFSVDGKACDWYRDQSRCRPVFFQMFQPQGIDSEHPYICIPSYSS